MCDPSAEVRSLLDREVEHVEAGMSSPSFCSPPLCVCWFFPPLTFTPASQTHNNTESLSALGWLGGGFYNLAEWDLGGGRGGAPAGQWQPVVRFRDLPPGTSVLVCPLLHLILLLMLTILNLAKFCVALNQIQAQFRSPLKSLHINTVAIKKPMDAPSDANS